MCFPLEPRYAGMCMFSTKKIETLMHAIWDTGLYDFVFVPEPIRTPSEIRDLYESISMPYIQPLLLVIWLLHARCINNNYVGNIDPPLVLAETVLSAVPSTSAGKLVIDRPHAKRDALFDWLAMPPPPRICHCSASLSGSNAKHLLTRLSTSAFCKLTKFDNANVGRTPTCVLALSNGRRGVPGGRGGVVKVTRFIFKLGSQPWPCKQDAHTCTHNYSEKKFGTPIMLISL